MADREEERREVKTLRGLDEDEESGVREAEEEPVVTVGAGTNDCRRGRSVGTVPGRGSRDGGSDRVEAKPQAETRKPESQQSDGCPLGRRRHPAWALLGEHSTFTREPFPMRGSSCFLR